MCSRMALCVSAFSASCLTAGAKPCCRFANNCCECPRPVVRMLARLKRVLPRCGSVHVVAARCFLSRASPLRNSTRNHWNGRFALTALNGSPVAARSSNTPAPPLYVCSDSAFGSNVTLRGTCFLLARCIRCPQALSCRLGFAQFRRPVLYPKLRNRIQIP
jgi:hypothetical protein